MLWVVVLNYYVSRVYVYLVWESFHTWSFWCLFAAVRDAIDSIYFTIPLDTLAFGDFLKFVSVIRRTDWIQFEPHNQASYISSHVNYSPVRNGTVGYFLYFHPFQELY